MFLFISMMILNFVIQGLDGWMDGCSVGGVALLHAGHKTGLMCTGLIRYTNKYIAIMYSCMCLVFILKKILKQKLEKLLEVEISFSFLLYKIALKLTLL
jgi:hypothetical protein